MILSNKKLLIKLILYLFFFQIGIFINAQSSIVFNTEAKIKAKEREVLDLVLKFNNILNDTLVGYVKIPNIKGVKFLSQENIKVKILPNKKAFIPLKFTVSSGITDREIQLVFDFYNDVSKKKEASSTTILEVPIIKGVNIFPHNKSQHYKQIGDSIFYEVKVINIGNQPDNVLVNSTYNDYQGIPIIENKRIKLEPLEERIVRFSKYVNYELMKIEKFSPMISLYDTNDVFAGNVFYTIFNVNSSRNFTAFSNDYYTGNINYIRFESRGSDLDNYSSLLQTHNEFFIGYNEYAYNLNTLIDPSNKRIDFYDTWIDYRRKGKGIRVGNISYGNLDIPIMGRGGILFQNLDELSNKIVIGAVENNTNILDELSFYNVKKTASAFVNTRFQINDNFLESSAVYQRTQNVQNFVVSNEYRWETPHKWMHNIKFSLGNVTKLDNSSSKPSFAIDANVSGKLGSKYILSSTNYYSSPYYVGSRKGNFSSGQRLQRNFNKFYVYALGQASIIKPHSIIEKDDISLKSSELKSIIFEGGISFKVFKNLSMVLYPRISYEKSMVFDGYDDYVPMLYSSNLLNSTFFLNSASRESSFMLNLSGGNYTINNSSASKTVLSSTLSWYYKNIRLFGIVKKGSLLLLDKLSGNDDITQYNISLSYKKAFFQNKLNFDCISTFIYNKRIGATFNLLLNSNFKLRDKLLINTSININHNNQMTSYYQLGVQYNLPKKSKNVGERYGNLNVFVYYDYNTNGVFDEGDIIADNRIVNINDVSFITSDLGNINYKKVPFGEYKISVPGQKWHAKDVIINITNKQTDIGIPMQLTGSVKGKLKLESRSKLEYDTNGNLYGKVIIFTNEKGVKTEIKTNDRGEFSAFLPIGEYTFFIQEDTLPINTYAEVYMHKVKIEVGKNIDYPPLILLIKEKKVNVKRFGN